MKDENAAAKRFIQDGIMIYSSGTLHHQQRTCAGYLYKRAEQKKLFQTSLFHKRYFNISMKQNFISISELPVEKKFKTILNEDIICL